MNENNNQNEKQEVSAIKKLIAKLHTSKISKKVVSLALVASFVTGFTGCGKENNSSSDSSISENSSQNSNNQASTKYGEHSELLQNVLNNSEYNSLISRVSGNDRSLLETPYFHAHPYGFLEDEGYDVQAIKKGNIETYSISYVLDEEPNNLYVHTRILENNSHYAHYLLKYHLTDLEMQDYNYMHTGTGYQGYYIQSAFMNDMISQMKMPEVVSECRMEKSCFEGLTKHLQKLNLDFQEDRQLIFTNLDTENNKFTAIIYPKYYTDYLVSKEGEIIYKGCNPRHISFRNGVYYSPDSFTYIIPDGQETKPCTYYFVQDNGRLLCTDYKIYYKSENSN